MRRECPEVETCELCGRRVMRVTRHHVRPRQYGGTETARLCSPCHRQVHALYTNRSLAADLNSIDRLREDPEIGRYLSWVRKQPDRHIPVRASRKRR